MTSWRLAIVFALCIMLHAAAVRIEAAPAPSPSTAPSPAASEPSVKDASVTGPGPMMDTYTIGAGQSDGYQAGDRIRVTRGSKILGEGAVFSAAARSAVITASGGIKLMKGDRVTFLHRKVAVVGPEEKCIVTRIEPTPPGSITDVENKRIAGRVNFFYYYFPSHAKCKELQPEFEKFVQEVKQTPGTALFIIDVGFQGSPLAARYNVVSLPTMGVMNRAGDWVTVYKGHSCRGGFSGFRDYVK